MIPSRAYKYALITIVVFVLLLVVALLWPDKRSREASPLRALQAAQSAVAPRCVLDSISYEPPYISAWCNVTDTARLYLDLEVRDGNNQAIDERTIETFVFASPVTPTNTLTSTIDVSELANGLVFIRARWAFSPWDPGVTGIYTVDGLVLEQDARGFVPFELFRQYFPGVMAVIE